MAESGFAAPAVGDIAGRRAIGEPIIGVAGAAQPIPAGVTTTEHSATADDGVQIKMCRAQSSGWTGMDKTGDATPTRAATAAPPRARRKWPYSWGFPRKPRGDSNPRPHHYERFP
jgi:hypothetical protein